MRQYKSKSHGNKVKKSRIKSFVSVSRLIFLPYPPRAAPNIAIPALVRSSSHRQNFFPPKLGFHHMPCLCYNVPSFNRSNVIKFMRPELDFVLDIFTCEMLFREL